MEQQPLKEYYPLGQKTFIIFVVKRIAIFLLPLIILVAIFILKNFIPDSFLRITGIVIIFLTLITVILFCSVIFLARLEYSHYAVVIDQNDFKVRHGVIAQEEIGVPYRRVKEAVIKREINDQLWGVSNIVITVLGEEEGVPLSGESTIELPSIEKDLAIEIQDQILKRSGRAQ